MLGILGIDVPEVGILVGVGTAVTALFKYVPAIMSIIEGIKKYIPPVIKEIEKRSADGEICAKDRKAIAAVTIQQTALGMGFKIGFIERRVISMAINNAVKLLPNTGIKHPVPPSIEEVVKKVVVEAKVQKEKNAAETVALTAAVSGRKNPH